MHELIITNQNTDHFPLHTWLSTEEVPWVGSCFGILAHGVGAPVSDHELHHSEDHRRVSLARGSPGGSDCSLQSLLLIKSMVLAPLSWMLLAHPSWILVVDLCLGGGGLSLLLG